MQRGEVSTEYTCSQAARPSASLGSEWYAGVSPANSFWYAGIMLALSYFSFARADRPRQTTNTTSARKRIGDSQRWFANIVASLRNDHLKIIRVAVLIQTMGEFEIKIARLAIKVDVQRGVSTGSGSDRIDKLRGRL